MKYWHSIYNPDPQDISVNVKEITDFVTKHGDNSRFIALYRHNFNSNSAGPIKLKTFLKVLNNNYLETDCFMLNNYLLPYPVQSPSGSYYSKWKIGDNNKNWTIDFDGKDINNIEEFLELLKKRDAPIPYQIVQTSEFGFHLLYKGSSSIWTPDTITSTALLVAGSKTKPYSRIEFDEVLKNGGVDPRYFHQDITMSKMRIPGTVNTKRDNFIVKNWFNKNYNTDEVTEIIKDNNPNKIINFPSYEHRKIIKKEKTKKFVRFESKRPLFIEAIKKACPRIKLKRLETIVDFFIDNLKRAFDGILKINQKYMAKLLNIDQSGVSRIIKTLIKNKIIYSATGGFIQKTTSIRYGFTAEFAIKIKDYKKEVPRIEKPKYNIFEPYEQGNTNTHKLRDIKYLYIMEGLSPDDITEFIYDKMINSGVRHNSKRDIDRSVQCSCRYWYDNAEDARLLHGRRRARSV